MPRRGWFDGCALVVLATGFVVELSRAGGDVARWGRSSMVALAVTGIVTTAALVKRWRADRHRYSALALAASGLWTAGFVASIGNARLADVGPRGAGSIGYAIVTAVALGVHLRRFARVRRLALLSDAALAAAATMVIGWELWLHTASHGAGWVHGLGLLAPPAAEALVASLALVMYLQERSRALMAAAATSALIFVGDTIVAATAGHHDAPIRLVAYGCWALALLALLDTAARPARRPAWADARPSSARVTAAYLPSLAAMTVLLVRHVMQSSPLHWGTVALVVVYGVALCLNQVVRWVETRTYADQLVASLHELAATGDQMRTLLDDLPQAVIVLDRNGVIRETNRVACDVANRTSDDLVGRHFTELLRAEDLRLVVDLWDRIHDLAPDDEMPEIVAISLAPPADPRLIVEVDMMLPLRDLDRIVVTLRDVTRTREQTTALDRVSERFRLAFHGGPTGMGLATAPDGQIIDANVSLASMLGISVGDLVGRSERDITHPDDWAPTRAFLERGAHGSIDSYHMEKRYLRSDGSIMWAGTWVSFLDDADGDRLAISHVVDVTEQRRAAEQLRWAATHDELTRLPNRARFMSELTERLASAPLGSTAVLFVDLDNFKVINDSLGHATGDQLLRGMTERLRGILRGRDMLSRFGGDEFIVLLSDCSAEASPRIIAERLLVEIARPLSIDGVELFVTGSLGIALAMSESTTASDLLRDADAAMYRAKARGRNCVEVFAPGADDASVLALRTAAELRHAIDRHEIVPYYQPIVDLPTGILKGFEVLARWRHPDRGLLGADQFLPMAEETGLIDDVGAAVLRASLVQLGRWRDRLDGFSDLTVAVNVSGRQLLSASFIDLVGDALAEAGVPAASLWLEITETALMTDVKSASVVLRELRSIGLHLSVDDFGTGYSSLTYLKRFPVEAIKIDRSFVNGLGIDAEDTTIVEAVVNLGHSLGLTVVAEGVETPLQLSRLRELGCDRAQGYLFGRPRPGEIIEAERALT